MSPAGRSPSFPPPPRPVQRAGRGNLPALSVRRAHAAQQPRHARGSFTGLSHLSDQARLAQAVMEGVTFAFRDCQRVLNDAGTSFDRLLAVGGGSKSNLWLKLIATTLDIEVVVPEDGDFGGALGVARLGALRRRGRVPAEVMTMPGIARTVVRPTLPCVRPIRISMRAIARSIPAIEEARK
jgi:xylulokinase